MHIALRLILLPVIAIAGLYIYGMGSWLSLNYIFAYQYPRPYLHMVTESAIASVLVALALSFIILKVYKKHAYLVGIISGSLILWLRMPDIFNYWSKEPVIATMGAIESTFVISFMAIGIYICSKLAKSA